MLGKRYMMTRKGGLWSDEPAKSGMAPINQNATLALGLLLKAQRIAPNAGTELWISPWKSPAGRDHCERRRGRDCGPIDTRSTLESRRRSYITTSDM